MTKTLFASMQTSQVELRKLLVDSTTETQRQVSTHIKTLSEQTREQVLALDKALSTELTKALESLGRQLTALSGKFVEDYMPLTDRLREVVQLARKMQ